MCELEAAIPLASPPGSSISVVLLGGSKYVDGSGDASDMIAFGLRADTWTEEKSMKKELRPASKVV